MKAGATDLWRMGSAELAAAIKSGEVSSREVVEAHLERIDRVNGEVRAITRVLAQEALGQADEADRLLRSGADVGPLHGVPFTVKENIDLAGSATTQAVLAMAEALPDVDAPQVERLRAAGAIPLARTNLPDFGLRWHTDNVLHGATRNPWDPARTPGGSSGGEAAALATGMSPLGLGNDLGGSLRWPSQCAGTAAIKPTLGRVAQAGAIDPVDQPISIQLMAVQGPMARRVADLRLALEVISGPSWRDPWSVPAPLSGPPLAAPMRVAVVEDPAGLGTSPQVTAGVRAAAEKLAAAGYAVEEVEPPAVARAAEVWLEVLGPDLRLMWQQMSPLVSPDANRFIANLFANSAELTPHQHMQALIERQALARAWGEFQLRHPLILGPVATEPPFALGADLQAEQALSIARSMRLVVAVNLLGLPSAAVPVGVADGLPQEVQIIGPRFREDVCLDAAEAIESVTERLTPIDPR